MHGETVKKYIISCRASAYFAYAKGSLFRGVVKLYLGFFEEGSIFKTRIYCMKIYVDNVFSHAVPFRTILSINVKSV